MLKLFLWLRYLRKRRIVLLSIAAVALSCALMIVVDSLFTADTPEQILNLHSEIVYNDGVDPRPYGSYTSSDWTNAVFGISTDFNLCSNVVLTPGLNYQITMEDNGDRGIYGNGVSPDHDIFWASLTLKYKF